LLRWRVVVPLARVRRVVPVRHVGKVLAVRMVLEARLRLVRRAPPRVVVLPVRLGSPKREV
jgi:hypothetical protein